MANDLQKGQHFMVDKGLIKRIVLNAEISEEDKILEVGSGEGALTKELLKEQFKELTCVELDASLKNPCKSYAGEKKVFFRQGNILEEIDSIDFNTVISNIPYHISEPLFKELFFKSPEKILVVIGNKFANILTSESIMGEIFRLKYEVSVLEEIPPTAFKPRPRTKSALVKLVKKKQLENNIMGGPESVIKQYFRYPRSKVKNFLEQASKDFLTKRFVRDAISAWVHGSQIITRNKIEQLLEKQLYSLSTEEFLLMKEFIYTKLFETD